jgi:hypothetical protein
MASKKELSPEALLYQLEMAFANVMNYPRNKQHQANLIRCEKEILRRLGGDYHTFDQLDSTPNES